jgi:hypothetical protein
VLRCGRSRTLPSVPRRIGYRLLNSNRPPCPRRMVHAATKLTDRRADATEHRGRCETSLVTVHPRFGPLPNGRRCALLVRARRAAVPKSVTSRAGTRWRSMARNRRLVARSAARTVWEDASAAACAPAALSARCAPAVTAAGGLNQSVQPSCRSPGTSDPTWKRGAGVYWK